MATAEPRIPIHSDAAALGEDIPCHGLQDAFE